jgi:hypothetical protein
MEGLALPHFEILGQILPSFRGLGTVLVVEGFVSSA